MKSKQLLVLFGAAVIVVAVGLIVNRSRQSAWQTPAGEGEKLVLPDFPVNDVTKFVVTDKDGTTEVAKKTDGRWRVAGRYDYPANYGTVSDFLRDLSRLQAAQAVNVGESQYGRLELLSPDKGENSGREVVFYGEGDKKLGAILLGKEHQRKSEGAPSQFGGGGGWPDGRYVLVPATGKVCLVSKTFSSVATKPKDWLDKDFFKIGDMKTGALTEDGKEVWRVSREKKGDDMKLVGLAEGEEQDDTDVRGIGNAFSWANFDDIADPALVPADTGMDKAKVFTATDFDGLDYEVRVGKETDDGKFHVAIAVAYNGPTERVAEDDESPEDKPKKDDEFKKKLEENKKKAADLKKRLDGWVYIVSKYTVEKVLKERKDFIKEKKEEKKEEAKAKKAPEAKKTAPPPPPPPLPAAKTDAAPAKKAPAVKKTAPPPPPAKAAPAPVEKAEK